MAPDGGLGHRDGPRPPLPPSKKSFKKLCNLKAFFSTSPGYIYAFLFVSSLAPFFEIIIFLIFEPLGVDFELSS